MNIYILNEAIIVIFSFDIFSDTKVDLVVTLGGKKLKNPSSFINDM